MLEFKKIPDVEKSKRYYSGTNNNNKNNKCFIPYKSLSTSIPLPRSSWLSCVISVEVWLPHTEDPLVFINTSLVDELQVVALPATDNCCKRSFPGKEPLFSPAPARSCL